MTTRAERARRRATIDRPVSLAEIPALIADVWPDEQVYRDAPRIWWWRTRHEHEIAHPMPAPISYDDGGGTKRAVGAWAGLEVVKWYARWKGLEVPEWIRRTR